jgi:preprotein translocase subunit SecF
MSHDSDMEVIGFFVKILKSVSAALLWMMTMILLGLRFKLAYPSAFGVIATIVFYVIALVSLFFTTRYIIKVIRTN